MFRKGYVKELWQIYLFKFLTYFYFPKAIFLLFFLYGNGISLSQIGFCTSVILFSNLVFEYPTGIFADRYGRKLSLQLSTVFMILASLSYVAGTFSFLLLASLLWGLAWSFASGADQALIYDSLKLLKKQDLMKDVTGLTHSLGFLGLIISTYAGYLLFNINLTYPFIASAIVYFIALLVISTYKEKRIKSSKKTDLLKTFKKGISLNLKNKVLLYLLLLNFFIFFFEMAWSGADQYLLIESGLSKELMSTYFVINSIIGFVGGILLPKLVHAFSKRNMILLVILLQTLCMLFISTGGLSLVIIFSYLLLLIGMIWLYVEADIIHDKIPSKIRATALSARQMLTSVVFLLNPWLMGYLVQKYEWSVFLFAGVFVFSSGMILFWMTHKIFVDKKA